MLLFLSVFFLLVIPVFALPSLPTEFYGRIRYYNTNASAGGVIKAYDSSGTLCGSFTIVNEGFYGTLTCKGDDPETPGDEGATAGENISFQYLSGYTTPMGNTTWGYGMFQYVNLTYPVVYCGDNFCDAWYENTYNCPEDCPEYNASINITINETNISEGEGGGGGAGGEGGEAAGGGAEGGALGLMPSFYMNYTGAESEMEGVGYVCEEDWVCGNWSKCSIEGWQNRTCVDRNNCGTFEKKPLEVQKCIYTPTCFDGVKNGLEEGIDCGGLCPPCITCFDGIQNCHDGLCEQGIDCGGPCPPCPTCFDGIQNCHDGLCEQGIDCGGPCEKKCPGIQAPFPMFKCEKDFNPLTNNSIWFFIIIIILIILDIAYSKKKIREIAEDKKLGDVQRAKAILSVRRKMYMFISISLLLSIILYLYYYFFIMCEVEYQYLWVVLLLLFSMPLIIHQAISFIEFTEKKRLEKLRQVLETHYKQMNNLVRIENEHLAELEEEISSELYRLFEKEEYKQKQGTEKMNLLREVYKKLVLLYTRYGERKNPIKDERILCDDIYELLEDDKYSQIIEQDSNLKSIVTKLKLVYKQYEEKQKLYDEMDKIEKSEQELGEKEDKSEDSDREGGEQDTVAQDESEENKNYGDEEMDDNEEDKRDSLDKDKGGKEEN